ncbi:MAG: TlpA disulfide reductase family protein [Bacteriovoracaceae bacterium]|jgi:thiol-disulfide isomerase/thioredoxin|nr:TlpA disulfide reductase family protein [Bacteriovoracaceae bacterium]
MLAKIIMTLLICLSFLSCTPTQDFSGHWKVELQLQKDQTLPFVMRINQKGKSLTGVLVNAKEAIVLKGKLINDRFILDIGAQYAQLVGKIDGQKLTGHWIRTNRKDYKVKFTADKVTKTHLFKEYENEALPFDLSGKWKVQLSKDKLGLGIFNQKGSRVTGSILTATGDYRFLDGRIHKGKLSLYGFDGTFSFILDLAINETGLKGMLYSGKNYHKEIQAIKDSDFSLPDPTGLTKLTQTKPLKLDLVDIDGHSINLDGEELKTKAKIIQVFGSWCPNCIDETRFFISWRKENKDMANDVEFIALAFENFSSKQEALKALRIMRSKLNMNYPLVLADYASTKTVPNFLPIDKTIAFPTTLFLNKKNEIITVHTGFSGQATEVFFTDFKDKFNQLVQKLVRDEI